MRILSTPALLLCLAATFVLPSTTLSAAAQEKDKSDADYIRSMELKWTESYKQRQVAMLSTLLADDFVITIEDGSTYSKTGYISHSAEPGTRVDVAEMS